MENYSLTNDKISIIMPAYNAEKTIEKSINSILAQTYKNIELIIINDGSEDNTEDVIKKFQKKDNRIKLISIANRGVSHARNVGIENASGEYIGFIDSDDTADSNMYEILMGLIKKYDVKIAHCSYKNVSQKGELLSVVGDGNKEILLSHDEAMEAYLSGRLFTGSLWNKLYHCSLFEEIRLDESLRYNEDILANFFLFDSVASTVYINMPCYSYVVNMSSATHSAKGFVGGENCVKVNRIILECSKGKKFETVAVKRYANSLLGLYRAYVFSGMVSKTKMNNLMKDIEICMINGLYDTPKSKISFFLCRYMPCLYRELYRFYDKIRKKKLDPEQ